MENYKILSLDQKIEFWEKKMTETLEEILTLKETQNASEENEIKISYLIGKIATLTVAMEDLGDRVRLLEKSS